MSVEWSPRTKPLTLASTETFLRGREVSFPLATRPVPSEDAIAVERIVLVSLVARFILEIRSIIVTI